MTTLQAQLTAAHLEKALEENSRLGDGEPMKIGFRGGFSKKNHGRLSSGSISIGVQYQLLVGGLEHFGTWLLFFHILGMSWSQLTNSSTIKWSFQNSHLILLSTRFIPLVVAMGVASGRGPWCWPLHHFAVCRPPKSWRIGCRSGCDGWNRTSGSENRVNFLKGLIVYDSL